MMSAPALDHILSQSMKLSKKINSKHFALSTIIFTLK